MSHNIFSGNTYQENAKLLVEVVSSNGKIDKFLEKELKTLESKNLRSIIEILQATEKKSKDVPCELMLTLDLLNEKGYIK